MNAHRNSDRIALLASAAALALICILVYLPGLSGPFLFDDLPNIDPARMDALSLDALWQAARSNESGMLGRPIAAISFALNDHFSQDGGPAAFKATNLVLHLSVALSLFGLARACLLAGQAHRSASMLALLIVAFWALHPLQVSTVLYSVQRMAQLSALFSVLSLLAYLRARGCLGTMPSRPWRWLGLAGACACAACLSKENGVLIPVFVLVLEATVLSRRTPRGTELTVRRIGIAASVVIVILLALLFLSMSDGIADSYANRDFTLIERLRTQVVVVAMYLGWIVIPDTTAMTFYHDAFRVVGVGRWALPASAILLTTLATVGIALRRRQPVLAAGLLFFFTAHLLESTFLPLELVFEHRNYLALFGIALALVDLGSRLVPRFSIGVGAIAACVAMLLTLSALTLQRTNVWGDHVSIALEATLNAPRSERAWIELANALEFAGEPEAAQRAFDAALVRLPDNAHLQLQRLRLDWSAGRRIDSRLERALAALRRAPLTPAIGGLLARMSEELEPSGTPPDVLDDYVRLFDAAWSSELRHLGRTTEAQFVYHHHRLLLGIGEVERALRPIRRAVELHPDNGELQTRLSETLTLAGRLEEAAAALSRAREIDDARTPGATDRLDEIERRIRLGQSVRQRADIALD